MFLIAIGIAGMVIDDVTVTIQDKEMGYVLDVHGALERTVRIEQDMEIPATAVDEGPHFLDILGLVDRDDIDLDAGLVLPVGIEFVERLQFAHTGFAPGGEEGDDDGFAALGKRGYVDVMATGVTQRDIGQRRPQREGGEADEERCRQ